MPVSSWIHCRNYPCLCKVSQTHSCPNPSCKECRGCKTRSSQRRRSQIGTSKPDFAPVDLGRRCCARQVCTSPTTTVRSNHNFQSRGFARTDDIGGGKHCPPNHRQARDECLHH